MMGRKVLRDPAYAVWWIVRKIYLAYQLFVLRRSAEVGKKVRLRVHGERSHPGCAAESCRCGEPGEDRQGNRAMIYYRFRAFLKTMFLSFRKGSLLLLSRFRTGKPARRVPGRPDRILVISQRRLGDAVLSLPVFSALRGRCPEAQIIVLCPPAVRGVFDLCSEVDDVMVDAGRGSLLGVGKIFRVLREKALDLVIDLNTDGSLFPALLVGLSGAGFSIGYGQDGRGVFFDESFPAPSEEEHTVERLLVLLEPLGIENPSREVRLVLPEGKRKSFSPAIQTGEGEENLPLVGVHPGATHWTQRWPVEYFAELADELIVHGPARVILCGGPSDWEAIRRVQERMRTTPDVAPPFPSLREFAFFLARLDLLVCNNSGPLHLACAVGTKTFSFMGPTRAAQWWPRGSGHHVFRRNDLPCIGCNRGYCSTGGHDCLRGILPGDVFETFLETFRRTAAPGPVAVHPS